MNAGGERRGMKSAEAGQVHLSKIGFKKSEWQS